MIFCYLSNLRDEPSNEPSDELCLKQLNPDPGAHSKCEQVGHFRHPTLSAQLRFPVRILIPNL